MFNTILKAERFLYLFSFTLASYLYNGEIKTPEREKCGIGERHAKGRLEYDQT
jgi:hypothetical protein